MTDVTLNEGEKKALHSAVGHIYRNARMEGFDIGYDRCKSQYTVGFRAAVQSGFWMLGFAMGSVVGAVAVIAIMNSAGA